jgi:hypothetical protein
MRVILVPQRPAEARCEVAYSAMLLSGVHRWAVSVVSRSMVDKAVVLEVRRAIGARRIRYEVGPRGLVAAGGRRKAAISTVRPRCGAA